MATKEIAIKVLSKRITSAQLKAMVATDVELVAAPGAGKVLIPRWAMLTLDYGTATYVVPNTDHTLTIGGMLSFDSDAELQALFEATADFSVLLNPVAGSTPLTANQALVIALNGTGEMTVGDGTLVARVAYSVLDEDTV